MGISTLNFASLFVQRILAELRGKTGRKGGERVGRGGTEGVDSGGHLCSCSCIALAVLLMDLVDQMKMKDPVRGNDDRRVSEVIPVLYD